MEKSANGFPRWHHSDGSYDWICPRCFITVGGHMSQPEIEIKEQNHVCSKINLNIARVANEAIGKGR
jgi:hypothetical protein